MENSKGGNQFVWIPVDGENLKYEQHKYTEPNADDHKGSTSDTGNDSWRTVQYRNYTEWTDTNGNAESVANNKGFYVGRYEAGIPKEAPFYSDGDGSTYWQAYYSDDKYGKNSLTEGSYTETYKTKNVTTYIPVSKKNTPSWNFITQPNAKTVASKMYGEDKGVTSSLIDSYAYDTVLQWLSNSSYNVASDNTLWGNYLNSEYLINGLYAKHEWKQDPIDSTGKTWRWYPAFTWSKGEYNKKNGDRFEIATGSSEYNKKNGDRFEIATGSSERNKANNIYDFAGNMWEWTTETRKGTRTDWNNDKKNGDRFEIATGSSERNKANNIYDFAGNMWEWTTETRKGTRTDWNNETQKDTVTSEQTFAVLRGGSYNDYGIYYPVSARYGSVTIGDSHLNIGFHVVLYIK